MRPVLFFGLIFILVLNHSHAQIEGDSLVQRLDSVVVIGIPESISQKKTIPFLNGSQDNIINALDALPQIRKIHENGYPLVFRGLSGNRIRIEKNGALRSGIVNQGYLLDDINPENTASIEAITGIESVISGSGALGGLIRIKDKVPSKNDRPFFFLKTETNNNSRSLGATLPLHIKRFNFRLGTRTLNTDNFLYGNGEEANNSSSEQSSINLISRYNSKNDKLFFTWNNDYSQGSFQRPQGFQNNPNELRSFRSNYSFQSSVENNILLKNGSSLSQNLWVLAQDYDQLITNFNFDFSAINIEETRNYLKESAGFRLEFATEKQTKSSFKLGTDLVYNNINERQRRTNNLNPTASEINRAERGELLAGVFSLAKVKFQQKTLGFSFRADIASIRDGIETVNFNAITGGIDFIWNQSSSWKNELSLTRKFRYPSQLEALGVFTGGRGVFYGNPELKPEFNHQLEWKSLSYIGNWEFNISTWFAQFNNRISELSLGNNEFTYDNIQLARTFGFETSLSRLLLTNKTQEFSTSLNASFIQGDEILESESLFSKGTPLIGIPPLRMRMLGNYKRVVSDKFSYALSMTVDRVSELSRIPEGLIRQTWAVQQADSYWLINSNVNLKTKLNTSDLTFGIGISNLFNATYYPFGARILGMGRNFRISLRLSI